jgi:hypothetical protein
MHSKPTLLSSIDLRPVLDAADTFLRDLAVYRRAPALHTHSVAWASFERLEAALLAPGFRQGFAAPPDQADLLNGLRFIREGVGLQRLAVEQSPFACRTGGDQIGVYHRRGGEVFEYDAAFVAEIEEGVKLLRPAVPVAGPPSADDLGDSYSSPAELAKRYEVPQKALEGRLRRWREAHQRESGAGWLVVQDRRGREAQYLYRVGTVRDIIGDLQAKGERGTKKNLRSKSPRK